MRALTAILAVVGVTVLVATLVLRRRRHRLGYREFTNVWADGERIRAEGVADAETILFERFLIRVADQDREMVVLHITFSLHGGGVWQAQDVVSATADRTVV